MDPTPFKVATDRATMRGQRSRYQKGGSKMNVKTIGIDLAKNVFQVHGVDEKGHQILKKRLSRKQFLPFFANLPHCTIGIEACGSSNYWARQLQRLDHDVYQMSPQYVKPYVKSNKNDYNDAEAICEAFTRPNMRFVSIKTIEQQDIQAQLIRAGALLFAFF